MAGITRYNSLQVTIVIFHNTNKRVFEKNPILFGGGGGGRIDIRYEPQTPKSFFSYFVNFGDTNHPFKYHIVVLQTFL